MGHSAYDPATTGPHPWNAGCKLGAKRALKLNKFGPFDSGSTANDVCGTAPCSTSPRLPGTDACLAQPLTCEEPARMARGTEHP